MPAVGIAFFGEFPSWLGWAGILVSTSGVLLMNLARPDDDGRGWRRMFVLDRGSVYALTCAALFAFTSFFFKEAIELLMAANPKLGPGRFEAAAHTVFHVAWMQVALATPAVAFMRPGELRRTATLWRTMLGIGITGFVGSLLLVLGLRPDAGRLRARGRPTRGADLDRDLRALVPRTRPGSQIPAITAIVSGVVLILLG